MFSITRTYLGVNLPLPTLPIDSIGVAYTFSDITIQSAKATEQLDISGVHAAITFDGDPFPLSGADYLTEVTSTIIVTVTESLAQGIYRFPFVNVETLYPLTGFALHGLLGLGIESYSRRAMTTALLVQSFTIPGVSLPDSGGTITVPTVTP